MMGAIKDATGMGGGNQVWHGQECVPHGFVFGMALFLAFTRVAAGSTPCGS